MKRPRGWIRRSFDLAAVAPIVAVTLFALGQAGAPPAARAAVQAKIEVDKMALLPRDLWEYVGTLAVSLGMVSQEFRDAFLAGIDEEPAYNVSVSGWLDHDGDVVAATLTTPTGEQYPFLADGPIQFELEQLIYGSIGSLAVAFPPGTYSLDITYADTRTEHLQAILLPYDLDSFPDDSPVAIVGTDPLTISWSTVAGSGEYEISAWGLPGPLDYDADDLYMAHPATSEHVIPGDFTQDGVYLVQVLAEQDFGLGGSFRFELNSLHQVAVDNRDGDGVPHYPGGPPCAPGQAIGCDDNCPHVPNAGQADTDGNGVGDACQCGDVNADGLTNVVDALKIARGEVLSSDPNRPRCDVNGDGLCNVTDALRIARGEVGSAPAEQRCPAYLGIP